MSGHGAYSEEMVDENYEYADYDEPYDHASYGKLSYDGSHPDNFSDYAESEYDDDNQGTEEEHAAATVIQCMVRRDQAIMFVDVLWEQTAAALSLQAVVRAYLTRTKFSKILRARKQISEAPRNDAPSAVLRATAHSDVQQARSTPPPEARLAATAAAMTSTPQRDGQQTELSGIAALLADGVQAGKVAQQRAALEASRKPGVGRSAPSKLPMRPTDRAAMMETMIDLGRAQDSPDSKQEQGFARERAEVPEAKQDLAQDPATSTADLAHHQLLNTGVAMRSLAALRSETADKALSRPPSTQNDASQQVSDGVHRRAAELLSSSILASGQPKRSSLENDAHSMVATGVAKASLHKFEEAAHKARQARRAAGGFSRAAANKKSWGAPLSSALPRLSGLGSSAEPGFKNRQNAAANSITLGAAAGAQVPDGSVHLFGLGSTKQQQSRGMDSLESSEITRGAASGPSKHQGATLVTMGSLMAQAYTSEGQAGKKPSPEVQGACGGPSKHQGGTLATNGSSSAPGMAHQKVASNAARAMGGAPVTGGAPSPEADAWTQAKSVDTGISLFAMGSVISQAKMDEMKSKGGGGVAGSNTFGAAFPSSAPGDLPLWSLGSSISVAAQSISKDCHPASSAPGLPSNGAVPLWSMGSASAPGMRRDAHAGGPRTNCSFAVGAHAKSQGATLLSMGSAGTPGMARELWASSNVAGATLSSRGHSMGSTGVSAEPTLLSMGSSLATGMRRAPGGGLSGVQTITSGAVGGMPLATGSKFIGTSKAGELGRSEGKGLGAGNASGALLSGTSVCHGGGTMVTSGSHLQMGRKALHEAEGVGRGITYGAETSGKPIYSGPTFSTAGSAGCGSGLAGTQSAGPSEARANLMAELARGMRPGPEPAAKLRDERPRTESPAREPPREPPHEPERYWRHHSPPRPTSALHSPLRPEKRSPASSYLGSRVKSPEAAGLKKRTSAGQDAVDRALARAQAAAAVIAASYSSSEEPKERRRAQESNRLVLEHSTASPNGSSRREAWPAAAELPSKPRTDRSIGSASQGTAVTTDAVTADGATTVTSAWSDPALLSRHSDYVTARSSPDGASRSTRPSATRPSGNSSSRRAIVDQLLESEAARNSGSSAVERSRLRRAASRQARVTHVSTSSSRPAESGSPTSETSSIYSQSNSSSFRRPYRELTAS